MDADTILIVLLQNINPEANCHHLLMTLFNIIKISTKFLKKANVEENKCPSGPCSYMQIAHKFSGTYAAAAFVWLFVHAWGLNKIRVRVFTNKVGHLIAHCRLPRANYLAAQMYFFMFIRNKTLEKFSQWAKDPPKNKQTNTSKQTKKVQERKK